MLLHLVNQSPFATSSLSCCLAVIAAGDSVLLFEDGVYGALADCEEFKALATSISIYALREDVKARGLAEDLSGSVRLVDYSGFVELTENHQAVTSWF